MSWEFESDLIFEGGIRYKNILVSDPFVDKCLSYKRFPDPRQCLLLMANGA